jgi:hypothetical protein
MAESGNKCFECGRLLKLFSGLTINGAIYHDQCWITRSKPVPQAPRVSRPMNSETVLRARPASLREGPKSGGADGQTTS